jgi:hypothetical protein
MFKEVMDDLWLAKISSLSNEVGSYVVLLEVLLRYLVQGRIHKLKNYVNSRPKSVFKDQEAVLSSWQICYRSMFKEVMDDLWLAKISSLSNEVGSYVVLLEVLLFMTNSLIRHSK